MRKRQLLRGSLCQDTTSEALWPLCKLNGNAGNSPVPLFDAFVVSCVAVILIGASSSSSLWCNFYTTLWIGAVVGNKHILLFPFQRRRKSKQFLEINRENIASHYHCNQPIPLGTCYKSKTDVWKRTYQKMWAKLDASDEAYTYMAHCCCFVSKKKTDKNSSLFNQCKSVTIKWSIALRTCERNKRHCDVLSLIVWAVSAQLEENSTIAQK